MSAALPDEEWSGFQPHPVIGPGRMRLMPACPACGGVKPELSDHPGLVELAKEWFGHRPDCEFLKDKPA